MNLKKIVIILGLLISSNQFAAEMSDAEKQSETLATRNITEKTLIRDINNASDEKEQIKFLIELGSYYYFWNNFTKARDCLEQIINLPIIDFKIFVKASLLLGKMYLDKQCQLLEEDKYHFSVDPNNKKIKYASETEKAKFYFELVLAAHKYFSTKNRVARDYNQLMPGSNLKNNDLEAPLENARATFYLIQILYSEIKDHLTVKGFENDKVKTQTLEKIHLLIDQALNNNLTTRKELKYCKSLQKKLPRLKRTSSGNNLLSYC